MRTGDRPAPRERGVAYLMLLLAIAAIGAVSASTVGIGSRRARAEAEDALLAVGAEFEQALTSYRGNAVANAYGGGPKTLEDLLKDPRSASPRRHLRALRPDPLTGSDEWGIARYPDGTIAGVYSLAPGAPIKETGFPLQQGAFETASSYAQWVFTARRQQPPQQPRGR